MSDVQRGSFRALAFGDLETGIWGAALLSSAGATASFAATFELDAGAAGEEWLLSAAGVELRFTPSSETAAFGPAVGLDGFMQVCEVSGALRREGTEQEVGCTGICSEVLVPMVQFESIRCATGSFGPKLGFAALAVRPRDADNHDADVVACAFVDDGAPLEIDEPRLSTTYADSGVPLRAGLELWPVEDERDADDAGAGAGKGEGEGEPRDEEAEQPAPYYPRRIAGDSERDASRLQLADATIRAELFRWRMRGREGAGVYALSPAP
jgi:hypothetical protein